jgi:hypothetical protein
MLAPPGIGPEIAFGQGEGGVRVDVPDDGEAGVARDVVPLEERRALVARGRLQVLHHPDRRPAIGVIGGEEGLGQEPPDPAVGAVLVVLAILILDHVLLDPELLLGERGEEVGHPVRLHRQDQLQVGGGEVGVVVGPVGRGRAVDGRPDALERLEVVAGEVLRALEHEVLEEVGQPPPVPLLVLGADVIPEVRRNEGDIPLAPEDDVQAVGERDLGVIEPRGGEGEGHP